jgi:phosphinothricin acetyltransferase
VVGATLAGCDAGAGRFLIVAERDGEILGYAKSGQFKEKAAYDTTCETSVYVADGHRGEGVGDALYRELLARLDATGLRLAVAGVTEPNPASERLHLAHGFAEVGTFHGVGVKLGRAWDVRWYERPLRGALSPPR